MPRMTEDEDPHQSPRELDRWEGHVVTAAATALTALVAMANPAVAVAAAVAQPGMDWALRKAWGEIFASRASRVESMLDAAADAAEVSADDVVAALTAEEEGAELLLSAADAAMATTVPGKLRALGKSLAAAYQDNALLDEELIFVAAVRAMQQPHMIVLRNQRERDEAHQIHLDDAFDSDPRVTFPSGLSHDEYTSWLAVPIAYGLVRQYSVYGGDAHQVTPFGLKFLNRAAEAADSTGAGS